MADLTPPFLKKKTHTPPANRARTISVTTIEMLPVDAEDVEDGSRRLFEVEMDYEPVDLSESILGGSGRRD